VKSGRFIRTVALLLVGLFGGMLALRGGTAPSRAAEPSSPAPAKPDDVAALRAEVDRLKGMVPDQSHSMADVSYHYSNLWFAAREGNWPLAQFYAGEVRSHLHWAVRIIPVRKNNKGQEIRLTEILTPIEVTNLKAVDDAVAAQDGPKFEQAYRNMMDSCYACHLAADKPYLKLRIPERPETPIVDFKGK
jgi:hypothetical protein